MDVWDFLYYGLIVGLVAPVLGSVAGFALARARRVRLLSLAAHSAAGFVLGVAILGLMFMGNCRTPPGKGPRAREGFARCEPVLVALGEYRQAHGAYPESLSAVAGSVPADGFGGARTGAPPYRRVDDGFELTFWYSGPGNNACVYRSGRGWACSGHNY